MLATDTDIDIDFPDVQKALATIPHVWATQNDGRDRHACGVYFQDVPVDPLTGFCVFDFTTAEDLGYFKIDFLSNSLYTGVRDETHLVELLSTEPDWDLLLERTVVEELAHIQNHFGLVQHIRPRSIEDLAVVLALIRPGKQHLVGRSRAEIDADVWLPGANGFVFKRSHAIAYAASIVVQLNLLVERLSGEVDDAPVVSV